MYGAVGFPLFPLHKAGELELIDLQPEIPYDHWAASTRSPGITANLSTMLASAATSRLTATVAERRTKT